MNASLRNNQYPISNSTNNLLVELDIGYSFYFFTTNFGNFEIIAPNFIAFDGGPDDDDGDICPIHGDECLFARDVAAAG